MTSMRELPYLYSFAIILNQKLLPNVLACSLQKTVMTVFSCQAHGVLQGNRERRGGCSARLLDLNRKDLITNGVKIE